MTVLDKINNPLDIKKLNTKELEQLASEIRHFLIYNISYTGGHLASNLGIVELTLSLLKNYDFTKDKIIFDVGHQSYVYKILTDRKDKFHTLRQYKGISGFPKREESKYDFFDTGHSSNSISASLGMARARDLKGENYHIISVIGDGSFTGGMVYEALNDLGYNKTKMLIILNDNQMSISKNVGGFSNCLNKIRLNTSYNKIRNKVHYKLDKKNKFFNFAKKIKTSIKSLFLNQMFFENLGVRYIGPVDGHNLKELNKIIHKISSLNEPVVLHVVTTKGLGYLPALNYPDKFHSVAPFNIETGEILNKNINTYSESFGNALVKLANKNKKIVAITAAMVDGTGLSKFKQKFKNRLFDIGIAEQHAVTFASGLALSGLKPVFAVYSTFLQRGFDQILIDVCMQKINVVFAIDRAGLVGSDGQTHHGTFDIPFLSMMPNMQIISPKVIGEMEVILKYAFNQEEAIAIRYPKGTSDLDLKPLKEITYGKWEKISDGEKVIILTFGKGLELAMKAKEKLNCNPIVINALFIKPMDKKILKYIVKENLNVLTLEDGNIMGGFGEQVLYHLNTLGFKKKIKIMGYEDHFIEHGDINSLLKQEKIDVKNIIGNIKELYENID